MEKLKKRAKIWLCIGIALMLLSAIVVSAVQTSGGTVTMKELMIETDKGYNMSAYLMIPENATVFADKSGKKLKNPDIPPG